MPISLSLRACLQDVGVPASGGGERQSLSDFPAEAGTPTAGKPVDRYASAYGITLCEQ